METEFKFLKEEVAKSKASVSELQIRNKALEDQAAQSEGRSEASINELQTRNKVLESRAEHLEALVREVQNGNAAREKQTVETRLKLAMVSVLIPFSASHPLTLHIT